MTEPLLDIVDSVLCYHMADRLKVSEVPPIQSHVSSFQTSENNFQSNLVHT